MVTRISPLSLGIGRQMDISMIKNISLIKHYPRSAKTAGRILAITLLILNALGIPNASVAVAADAQKKSEYRPGVSEQRREIEFHWAYDKTAACVANAASSQANSGLSGNGSLPDSVPGPYHDIFIAAAAKHNAPPAIVAAIFFAGEHGHSWPDPPPPYGGGKSWETSYANAQGPFQFLPGTWGEYGDDGNGDGKKDIQDLTDAAFGAANYLAANGAVIGAPDGPRGTPSIENAIWLYNHSQKYLDTVMQAYHEFSGAGTGISTVGSAVSQAAQQVGVCSSGSADGDAQFIDYTGKLTDPSINSTLQPTAIILHWWGFKGGIDSLVSGLNSRGLSVQIGATLDGKLYQLTPQLNSYAQHAKCVNKYAIGIEIEGEGPADLAGSQPQFNSVVSAVKTLMQKFSIPVDGVIQNPSSSGVVGVHSHKEVDALCPTGSGKDDVDDTYLQRVKDAVK